MDQSALLESFQNYLESGFDQEIGIYDTELELEEFGQTLESIARWCSYSIDNYLYEIYERISAMEKPEDEDEAPVHKWDTASGYMSEYMQEKEIKRMFEGLNFRATT